MPNPQDDDWPGKADGVPRPPTKAYQDQVSSQQALITDEWAPEPPKSPDEPPP